MNDSDYLTFSQSFMSHLDETAAKCNYTSYYEKYLTYPPQGVFPLPGTSTEAEDGCYLWNEIFNAALLVNPAFNIYSIFDVVSFDHPRIFGQR